MEFSRNFLPVGKGFTIPAADYLPVGNGVARLGGGGDKTSVSPPTPDTIVVWPLEGSRVSMHFVNSPKAHVFVSPEEPVVQSCVASRPPYPRQR